jgi:hypothetical protein
LIHTRSNQFVTIALFNFEIIIDSNEKRTELDKIGIACLI